MPFAYGMLDSPPDGLKNALVQYHILSSLHHYPDVRSRRSACNLLRMQPAAAHLISTRATTRPRAGGQQANISTGVNNSTVYTSDQLVVYTVLLPCLPMSESSVVCVLCIQRLVRSGQAITHGNQSCSYMRGYKNRRAHINL
jgi:hypothetical protein